MLFADFMVDLCFWPFVVFLFLCWGLGSVITSAAKSDTAKAAAKIGFWYWLTKDD